jgi:hypothetical protein
MKPLSSAERAEGLAQAAAGFAPWLGPVSAEDLLGLIRAELGHEAILDDFQTHGGHFAKAAGPDVILHVVSGNTPHAGLQSLLRGLLLGSHNLCKLPAGGLPEITAFRDALPPELAPRVELSETLPDEWIARADALIVFGSDETVAALRQRARPGQTFIAHGHRVSLGLVLDDSAGASIPAAARAASLFDQQGCLSPHGFYVRGDAENARAYAARLADAMRDFNRTQPRAALPAGESARIGALREDWRFRAANDPARFGLWHSERSTAWTVLFEAADPVFRASPLNRVVFVKPLPEDLPAALAPARAHLSAIGLWPATRENADWLASLDLGASRLCPLERMQSPPLTWRQDGAPVLAGLVRWIGFEPG